MTNCPNTLFHQLKALEQQHPECIQADTPTNKVGGQALSKFESVTHAVPMLSLGNVFSEAELSAFNNSYYAEAGASNTQIKLYTDPALQIPLNTTALSKPFSDTNLANDFIQANVFRS